MAKSEMFKGMWVNRFRFVVAIWLLSRLLILTTMFLVAPSLPTPPGAVTPVFGWGIISQWDSLHYQNIATVGYEYARDGGAHTIAFFPLFPLIIRGVMTFGLSAEAAGALVNNLAFLGALIVLYGWVEERHGVSAARWATAVLAWCPFSVFGTVIYSEGLFLLLSTAAMQAFDRRQYAWVALWGALATATRPTGMALIPAFLIAAWIERRGAIAYAAGLATSTGLILFSLYCAVRFGDPLAFVEAQRAWRPSFGFEWRGWSKTFLHIFVGHTNWKRGSIVDPLHPLLFSVVIGCGYLLWRFRSNLSSLQLSCGFWFLAFVLWLLAGDPFITAAIVFGGGYLLWHLRTQLSPITVVYGFCGLGLLLASGGTFSLSRIAYGVVSLSIAFGVLLARHSRWGYGAMGFFAIVLVSFALRFARHLWVA